MVLGEVLMGIGVLGLILCLIFAWAIYEEYHAKAVFLSLAFMSSLIGFGYVIYQKERNAPVDIQQMKSDEYARCINEYSGDAVIDKLGVTEEHLCADLNVIFENRIIKQNEKL